MATVASPSRSVDQRVVLRGIDWQTYERILADQADTRTPRLTYDRGELEILSPGFEHELNNGTLQVLVEDVAFELGIEVVNVGSMTYRRRDLDRGFEPDSSFYIKHEPLVRGKREIDPNVDPPPDLVIEIEASRSAIPKLPLYAALGVPELWRFDGERVVVLQLVEGEYHEVSASVALPVLTVEAINELLRESRTRSRIDWRTLVRDWARSRRATP
jgi:Uma2 family endonuclease